MNGLRYIRTRCNLSLNELADFIGVTRQALSSWENGKKEIPVKRKEQLANFFGIDNVYFGEISEEEKKYLLEKAMFRYDDNGKETYRYKPQEGLTSLERVPICFLGDMDISLDEKYVLAQRRKQETIAKIDDIIRWTSDAGSIQSQTVCINRGCNVYGMINEMMETMRGMKTPIKMPFFYELIDVLKATLLAYGLRDKGQIQYLDRSEYYCGEDGEWIIRLSQQIKEHWDAERNFHEKHYEEMKKDMRKKREEKKDVVEKVLGIEEQIAEAEEHNRQFMREHPELLKMGGLTILDK